MEAEIVVLDQLEIDILEKITRSKTLGTSLKERARMILAAAEGYSNRKIGELFQFEEHRVGLWRTRWINQHETWKQLDPVLRPPMSQKLVFQWLADQKGRGKKPTITEEQKAMILALACEPPSKSGYPNTHWTDRLLAREVVRRGIVESISHIWIWAFLKDKRSETAQKPVLPEVRRQRKRPGPI